MDEILELIRGLRDRIKRNHQDLLSNEMSIRQELVEPLLHGLGWNIENSHKLRGEFEVRIGRVVADYVLFTSDEEPILIVEVVRYGEPLERSAQRAEDFCVREGYRYFAATDGSRWEIYDTRDAPDSDSQKIISVDIEKDRSTDVCVLLMNLWRERFVIASETSTYESAHPIVSQKINDQLTAKTQPLVFPLFIRIDKRLSIEKQRYSESVTRRVENSANPRHALKPQQEIAVAASVEVEAKRELREKLLSYPELPKNWDLEGAKVPPSSAAKDALRFLDWMPDGVPLPYPEVGMEGEIGVYWDNTELDSFAEAVFEGDGAYTYFATKTDTDGLRREFGEEGLNVSDPWPPDLVRTLLIPHSN